MNRVIAFYSCITQGKEYVPYKKQKEECSSNERTSRYFSEKRNQLSLSNPKQSSQWDSSQGSKLNQLHSQRISKLNQLNPLGSNQLKPPLGSNQLKSPLVSNQLHPQHIFNQLNSQHNSKSKQLPMITTPKSIPNPFMYSSHSKSSSDTTLLQLAAGLEKLNRK